MKKLILTTILCVFAALAYTQVTITSALNGANICINNPTATSITDITIGENNNNDIAITAAANFVLSLGAGSGFQWAAVPSVASTGSDIADISITTVSGTEIEINITVTGTGNKNNIILSNLWVRAIAPPSVGTAAIITRPSGAAGGTANVTGSVGMNYGLLSSTNPPNFFITNVPIFSCSNLNSIVLNATPSVAGGVFTLQYLSGSGDISNALNLVGSSYRFSPNSITGLNSTATSINIVYSVSINGCVSKAVSSIDVFDTPQVDFSLPSVSGVAGRILKNAAPFTMIPTPSGGVFSGNGVFGNTFDPFSVVSITSYDIAYDVTDNNGCSNSVTKQIEVISQTGTVLSLKSNYCTYSPSETVTFNNIQNYVSDEYEIVNIIGPGISGFVGDGVSTFSYTFNPSAVPLSQLDIPQPVFIITRRKVHSTVISRRSWNTLAANTCLGAPITYFNNILVNLPFSGYSTLPLKTYPCSGPYANGMDYTVSKPNVGSLINQTITLDPFWNFNTNTFAQFVTIRSRPPIPSLSFPADSNCVGNTSFSQYNASGSIGAVFRWWVPAATITDASGNILTANASAQGSSKSASDLNFNSSTTLGGYDFKVTQETNNCISLPRNFKVNFYDRPLFPQIVVPTISGLNVVNFNVCQNSISNIPLSVSGTWVRWYSSNGFNSGNLIKSGQDFTDFNFNSNIAPRLFTYFASQTVNGCETPSPGLQVNVNVTSLPGVVGLSNSFFEYCLSATSINVVTVTASYSSNLINTYKYSSFPQGYTSVGQNMVNSSSLFFMDKNLLTSAGVDFNQNSYRSIYTSQTENGCEGPRTGINFNIYAAPDPPSIDNPNGIYCNGLLPSPITVTSTNIVNLFDSTGTVLYKSDYYYSSFPYQYSKVIFDISTVIGLSGTFQYAFTQTFGVCTSTSALAKVSLQSSISGPNLNTALGTNAINTFCTLPLLEAKPILIGAIPTTIKLNIVWSTDLSHNNIVSNIVTYLTSITGTTATDQTYYAFQESGGCFSVQSTPVRIKVYNTPIIPTVSKTVEYCSTYNSMVHTLTGIVAPANTLTWYLDRNLTTVLGTVLGSGALSSGVALSVTGTNVFYATQTAFNTTPDQACESKPEDLTLKVNTTPVPVININYTGIPNVRTGVIDTLCRDIAFSDLKLSGRNTANGSGMGIGIFYKDTKLPQNSLGASPNIAIASLDPGVYKLIYNFRDVQSNCEADTVKFINVLPLPNVDFNLSSLCVGDTVSLLSTANVSAPDEISKYVWKFYFAQPLTTDSVSNPKVLFNSPSLYPIDLTVATKLGCFNKVTKARTVEPYPTVKFAVKNICLTDATLFTNQTNFGVGTFKSLVWDFGDGDIVNFNALNTTIGTSKTFGDTKLVNHIYSQEGVYLQKLTASSLNNCVTSITNRSFILPKIKVTPSSPYVQNFENGSGGFVASEDNSSWEYGTPAKKFINKAASGGSKAWVTSLTGRYLAGDTSAVRCPCFDISEMSKPMISLKIRSVFDRPGVDGVVLQVSDGSDKWYPVGNIAKETSSGLNWYNQSGIVSKPGNQAVLNVGWSSSDSLATDSFRLARYKLDEFRDEGGNLLDNNALNRKSLQFRLALGSSAQSGAAKSDGFAFDDFSVLERDKLLLIENFTNTASSNTNGTLESDKRADLLINTNSKDVLGVYYHTAFPNNADVFNRANVADPSARTLFYGVSQTPNSVLSGNKFTGSSFGLTQSIIDKENLLTAKFRFDISKVASGNTFYVNATVTAKEDITDETILNIALVERTVTGANAGNGQTRFEWVMRSLLPDAAGTSIKTGWATNQSRSYSFSATLTANQVVDPSMIGVVGFIQNKVTKEIYQASYDGPQVVPSTTPVDEAKENTNGFRMFPNPTENEVTLWFDKAVKEKVAYEIYNQWGVQVLKGELLSGTQRVTVYTSTLSSGVYIVAIHPASEVSTFTKLTVVH